MESICSDAHHSYKGFAKDAELGYHPINAFRCEKVMGVFHVQHINSKHNRVKKWIGSIFWGVSTKYLQQYLNWYAIKEKIKTRSDTAVAFVKETVQLGTLKRFAESPPIMKI